MSKGLLIIDMQNDYFTGGAMALEGCEHAAQNCHALLQFFRQNKRPVWHIQHISNRPGATFFLPDSYGAEIHATLQPLPSEAVIVKHYPSAFRETRLQAQLQANAINELVICGAMSHMCIDTSVRAAFDLGYQCTVIADACATKNLKFNDHEVAAADVQAAFMAALQVPFATILNTQSFLRPL